MGKYFRTIYLYIVSFGTLCMLVAGFVGTVNGVFSYLYPVVSTYLVDFDQDRYETNCKEIKGDYSTDCWSIKEDYKTLEDAETIVKRAKLKETFTYLAVFVCGAPLYLFHSNQLKKESEKEV